MPRPCRLRCPVTLKLLGILQFFTQPRLALHAARGRLDLPDIMSGSAYGEVAGSLGVARPFLFKLAGFPRGDALAAGPLVPPPKRPHSFNLIRAVAAGILLRDRAGGSYDVFFWHLRDPYPGERP
jgi:hypothetical protein